MNAIVNTINNPFSQNQKQIANGALVDTESQRAIQEVQASLVIAKKFPRNQADAFERVIQACGRKSLAESALYSYPRGGTNVTGASIRMAEAIAQNWGNIQYGIKELSQENGSSTVEVFAWDLETNTRQVKIFQVPHLRYKKSGSERLTDPRDIYEMIANNGARRLRACILGVIPGDVIEAAIEACEATLRASADTSPAGIKTVLDYIGKEAGITREMVEKKFGRKAEAMEAGNILQLRKIVSSIVDGMSKVEDWFEVTPKVDTNKTLDDIPKTKPIKQEKEPEIKPEVINGTNEMFGANQ